MTRQTIQDKNYRTIGYIETMADGRQKALDNNYRTLGYYDPKRNVTQDASYKTVAQHIALSHCLVACILGYVTLWIIVPQCSIIIVECLLSAVRHCLYVTNSTIILVLNSLSCHGRTPSTSRTRVSSPCMLLKFVDAGKIQITTPDRNLARP